MTFLPEIEKIVDIALLASQKVLEVYGQDDFKTEVKDDNSPLTLADKVSQETILKGLKQSFPDIPVISEESAQASFKEREDWEYFWLVDPLDGTKEFIKRNGEFTVNIALIKKNRPILGVVSLPAKGVLYFGQEGKGAFKQSFSDSPLPISVKKNPGSKVVMARSRSHASHQEAEISALFTETQEVAAGSSLKFCYVAEGKADLYVRLGRTMEWDTAAGQAVLEASGGKIFDLTGATLLYNKEGLDNRGFFSIGGRADIELIIKDYINKR